MSQPPQYPGQPSGADEPPENDDATKQAGQPSYGSYPPPQTHQSYGSSDYGNQYGGQYGAGAWQGGNDASRSTDGVSIAGFIFSLTCCLSFVGVILGIIGLGRTKDGQRKGRWAAITAIILGLVLTVGVAVGGFFVWKYVEGSISLDSAEVGQCMDINEDNDTVFMQEKECDETHDAEIVWVGEAGDLEQAAMESGAGELDDINDLTDSAVSKAACSAALEDEDAASLIENGDLDWQVVTEDPDDVQDGDDTLCYVADEGNLDEPLLD